MASGEGGKGVAFEKSGHVVADWAGPRMADFGWGEVVSDVELDWFAGGERE